MDSSTDINVDFSLILREAAAEHDKEASIHNLSDDLGINLILLGARSSTGRYFCPFCGIDHGFEFLLAKHLSKNHQKLVSLNSFDFIKCSYCQVNFAEQNLLLKHLFTTHSDVVLPLVSNKQIDGKHVKCLFCVYHVLIQQNKRLLLHLENKHSSECVSILLKKGDGRHSVKKSKPTNSLSLRRSKTHTNQSEFKRLCQFFHDCKLKAEQNKDKKVVKSILKTNSFKNNKIDVKKSARKSLRFDFPESKKNLDKENVTSRRFSLRMKMNKILNSNKNDFRVLKGDDYHTWASSLIGSSTPRV